MKRYLLFIVSFFCLSASSAWAQPKVMQGIGKHIYPAEMVMRYHQEIGLSEKQQKSIRAEMKKVQNKLFDLHWEMQKAAGTLSKSLSGDAAKEAEVMSKLDVVLKLEHQIKRTRMVMLVRIRNLLSARQRSQLDEYKNQHRPLRPGMRGRQGFDKLPGDSRGFDRPQGLQPGPQ